MKKMFYLPENGKVEEVLVLEVSTDHEFIFVPTGCKYFSDAELEKCLQFDTADRFKENKGVEILHIVSNINMCHGYVKKQNEIAAYQSNILTNSRMLEEIKSDVKRKLTKTTDLLNFYQENYTNYCKQYLSYEN